METRATKIIPESEEQPTPFITTSSNIKGLSQIDGLAPRDHVCDGKNISAHAVVAVVRNNDGVVRSQLYAGTITPDPASGSIDKDTTIAVGSVTKMFTSSALLKLWDNELTAKNSTNKNSDAPGDKAQNFPEGIDTPLSHFMDRLQKKFQDCTYLETIKNTEHYKDVTLRDLLNHTHALGSRDDYKIAAAQMEDPSKRFSCSESVKFSKQDPNDVFGKFNYSNLGTDLAGMVIELVTGKEYEQALKGLVLEPVGAINTGIKGVREAETKTSAGYCYITPFLYKEKDFPYKEKKYSGEMNYNTAGNSMAAGGLKTTAEDADKFIRKFLSEEAGENSLFKNQAVVDALFRDKDKKDEAGKDVPHSICGVNKYTNGEGDVVYGHNGHNGSSEASLKFNPKTRESFFYGAVGETLSFAVATETLLKSGIEKPKLGEILSRRDELGKAGFGFEKMKSMVDEKISFQDIADEAIKTLKSAENKKSSGQKGVSGASPSPSPGATIASTPSPPPSPGRGSH